MGKPGRFFSDRDMRLINSVVSELMEDVIQTMVTYYKPIPTEIKVNIYGESSPSEGKVFYPGIPIFSLIERTDISTETNEFGIDRVQIVRFRFKEKTLKDLNLYPEHGDIILFNERYHEIDNVIQEQFLGGVDDKSFSIVCETHYSRLTKLTIFDRQK